MSVDIATISPSASAAYHVMRKLREGLDDVCIALNSDSTAADSNVTGSPYWFKKLALWLGTQFPAYTVLYYQSPTTSWPAPTTLQTGTGSKTLYMFNAAISGTQMFNLYGSAFAVVWALVSKDPDLIILNHGKNNDSTQAYYIQSALYQAGLAQLQLRFPHASLVICAQTPNPDNTQQDVKALASRRTAELAGAGLADFYGAFMDAGNPVSYYNDATNVHQSQVGDDVMFGVMKRQFAGCFAPLPNRRCSLADRVSNLLTNGDFSSWASTDPDSWTMTGCTSSKDTTNFETGTQGMKLTTSGGAQGFAKQTVTGLKRYAGQYLTIAARIFIANATTDTSAGEIQITNGTPTNFRNWAFTSTGNRGGFFWVAATGILLSTDTQADITIYASTSGSAAAGQIVTVDRIILVPGVRPMDMV